MSEAKLSPAKGSAESPWATWSKVDVADEIRRRVAHFYLQTDGTMKFPNSAEGDLLKMVHVLLSPNNSITGGGTPYRECTGSASQSKGEQT